ncbi:class I SAM-dependent methyltransferase [Planctomycetota bacterium]
MMDQPPNTQAEIAVRASGNNCIAAAEVLARQLGLPLLGPGDEQYEFELMQIDGRLELHHNVPKGPGPVAVDFVGGDVGHRRKFGRQKREAIGQAAGIYKHKYFIVDATAGMGKDAFWFALRGCRVLGLERSPVVAAMLQDGLARALADDELGGIIGDKLSFRCADAREILPVLTGDEIPDVVYIDVMYPEDRRKPALPGKDMQVLRRLLGDDGDAGQLLAAARQVARSRVVVKRPRYAPPLAGKPSLDFSSAKTRFDVYLS